MLHPQGGNGFFCHPSPTHCRTGIIVFTRHWTWER